jgi:hypothetical protein
MQTRYVPWVVFVIAGGLGMTVYTAGRLGTEPRAKPENANRVMLKTAGMGIT